MDLLVKYKRDEISSEVTLLENELSRAVKYRRRSEEIRHMSAELIKDAKKKSKVEKAKKDLKSSSSGKKKKRAAKYEVSEDISALITASMLGEYLSPSSETPSTQHRNIVGNLKGQRPRSADLPLGVTFKDPPVEEDSTVGASKKDSPISSPHDVGSSRPQTSHQRSANRSAASSTVAPKPRVRVSTAATRRAFGTSGGIEVESTQPKMHPNSLKGQRVVARDAQSGFYYPGVVLSCPKPGEAHVQFDSTAIGANNQLVLVKHLIPTSGAIGRPSLCVDDACLTRVLLGETKDEIWIPCHVTHLPNHAEDQTLQVRPKSIALSKKLI